MIEGEVIREGGVAAGVRALVPTAARALGPQTECTYALIIL